MFGKKNVDVIRAFFLAIVIVFTMVIPAQTGYAQVNYVITHYLDDSKDPIISGSQNVTTLAFFDPPSGEVHFQFTGTPNRLPIYQYREANADFQRRRIQIYAKSVNGDGHLRIKLERENQLLIESEAVVPQGDQWNKVTFTWNDDTRYFNVILSGSEGLEVDNIVVTAQQAQYAYLPLLTKDIP